MKSVMLTSCGGMVFGVCAQVLYFQFEIWRRRKALEIHYPELVWSPDRAQWSFVSGDTSIVNCYGNQRYYLLSFTFCIIAHLCVHYIIGNNRLQ